MTRHSHTGGRAHCKGGRLSTCGDAETIWRSMSSNCVMIPPTSTLLCACPTTCMTNMFRLSWCNGRRPGHRCRLPAPMMPRHSRSWALYGGYGGVRTFPSLSQRIIPHVVSVYRDGRRSGEGAVSRLSHLQLAVLRDLGDEPRGDALVQLLGREGALPGEAPALRKAAGGRHRLTGGGAGGLCERWLGCPVQVRLGPWTGGQGCPFGGAHLKGLRGRSQIAREFVQSAWPILLRPRLSGSFKARNGRGACL